jgi:hypothetical protein
MNEERPIVKAFKRNIDKVNHKQVEPTKAFDKGDKRTIILTDFVFFLSRSRTSESRNEFHISVMNINLFI